MTAYRLWVPRDATSATPQAGRNCQTKISASCFGNATSATPKAGRNLQTKRSACCLRDATSAPRQPGRHFQALFSAGYTRDATTATPQPGRTFQATFSGKVSCRLLSRCNVSNSPNCPKLQTKRSAGCLAKEPASDVRPTAPSTVIGMRKTAPKHPLQRWSPQRQPTLRLPAPLWPRLAGRQQRPPQGRDHLQPRNQGPSSPVAGAEADQTNQA